MLSKMVKEKSDGKKEKLKEAYMATDIFIAIFTNIVGSAKYSNIVQPIWITLKYSKNNTCNIQDKK